MNPIPVTMGAAAILGLIYLVLSINVVRTRVQTRTDLGAGEDQRMQVAIRAHGNFAEYVPFILLLLGALEATGGPRWLVLALAGLLIAARLAHPFGLTRPAPNPPRLMGAVLTFAVLGVASVTLLLRVVFG